MSKNLNLDLSGLTLYFNRKDFIIPIKPLSEIKAVIDSQNKNMAKSMYQALLQNTGSVSIPKTINDCLYIAGTINSKNGEIINTDAFIMEKQTIENGRSNANRFEYFKDINIKLPEKTKNINKMDLEDGKYFKLLEQEKDLRSFIQGTSNEFANYKDIELSDPGDTKIANLRIRDTFYEINVNICKDKQLSKLFFNRNFWDETEEEENSKTIELYMKAQLTNFALGKKTNGMKIINISIPVENQFFKGKYSDYNYKDFVKAFLKTDKPSMDKIFNNVTKDTKENYSYYLNTETIITGKYYNVKIYDYSDKSLTFDNITKKARVYTLNDSFAVPIMHGEEKIELLLGTIGYRDEIMGYDYLKSNAVLMKDRIVSSVNFNNTEKIDIKTLIPRNPTEARICNELVKFDRKNNQGQELSKDKKEYKFPEPSNWNKTNIKEKGRCIYE